MSRRIPVVRQMESADCGAACLAMVLAHHGRHVGLDELRHTTGTDRNGVDGRAILEAARAYGLAAQGVAAEVHDVRHLPRGSILHWEFRHFVVLERVRRRGVEVVDPAQGRRIVPFDVFGHAFTGVAMVFEPSAGFARAKGSRPGTWRYLRPLLGQSRALTRVLVTSALLRLFALTVPVVTALVVDEVAPRNDLHLLVVLVAAAAGVAAYYFLAALLRGHLLLQLRTRLDVTLTTGFVDHLVGLPYAFFLKRSAGDLMMRLGSNSAVRDMLTTGALSAIIDGSLASLYMILLGAVSVPLALLVLALAVVQVAVLGLSWRRNQLLMAESLQVEARAQSYAYELLAGIETLKASGSEHRGAERWAGLYVDQVNVSLSRGRLNAVVDAAMTSLRTVSPLAVLLYGGYQVIAGHLSLGTMLAVVALSSAFLEPLATLVTTGLQLQVLASYMERINDVLDSPREQHAITVRPAPQLRGHITAHDVSFAYSPLTPPVVRGVSLDVHPGQHVAIVGRSGSGKSTLAHLLLGLYRPDHGRVCYDGHELAELEVRSVRRQLGIVTQRPYLFASTIRENITLADPEAPLEAVIEAARLACIDADIARLPMGYETTLHDGGSGLSGGQRQRLALARALVHRPSILVLDEATSELDAMTEQRVYENLSSLRCTIVVIAHRLSTVRNADMIFVMDDGQIVEQGNHARLMRHNWTYVDLVTAQSNGSPRTGQDPQTSSLAAEADLPCAPSMEPARHSMR